MTNLKCVDDTTAINSTQKIKEFRIAGKSHIDYCCLSMHLPCFLLPGQCVVDADCIISTNQRLK